MPKPKPNLKSIMLKELKVGDEFKTSPTHRIVVWKVVEIKHHPIPTPAGFPQKMETKALTGSNLAVYVEVTK
jgi:hypothetical protein